MYGDKGFVLENMSIALPELKFIELEIFQIVKDNTLNSIQLNVNLDDYLGHIILGQRMINLK